MEGKSSSGIGCSFRGDDGGCSESEPPPPSIMGYLGCPTWDTGGMAYTGQGSMRTQEKPRSICKLVVTTCVRLYARHTGLYTREWPQRRPAKPPACGHLSETLKPLVR